MYPFPQPLQQSQGGCPGITGEVWCRGPPIPCAEEVLGLTCIISGGMTGLCQGVTGGQGLGRAQLSPAQTSAGRGCVTAVSPNVRPSFNYADTAACV